MSRFFILLILNLAIATFTWTCKSSLEIKEVTSIHYDVLGKDGAIEFEEKIKPYRMEIMDKMSKVVSISETEMVKGQPESLLGNFISDLMLDYAQSLNIAVDMALMNNGGLRAPLPKGQITVGNIFEMMPFENEIVIVKLNPEGVAGMFDYIAASGGVPISGIKLTLKDGKVINPILNSGKPIGYELWLVTTDYLLNGGDKMGFMRMHSEVVVTGVKLRDAIINYCIKQMELGNTLNPKLDQRIRIWKEGDF